MSEFDRWLRYSAYTLISDIVLAVFLAQLIPGVANAMAKLYVLFVLNILSAPLLITDVFVFPTWVWFVVAVKWLSSLSTIHEYFYKEVQDA